jgi:hypothetical protein
MSNEDKLSRGQWWFALKKEDGQGIKHQIVEHNKEEEGGVPTEPEIITWSEPIKIDNKEIGGYAWRGTPEEFQKRFKWIGFEKKKE